MGRLHTRAILADITGGYIHMIVPDIGEPSGWASYRTKLEDFVGVLTTGTVEFYDSISEFPITGDPDILYVARDTNLLYEWTGSAYEQLEDQSVTYQILSYDSVSSFPITGAANTIYIDRTYNRLYRWDGAAYVELAAETIMNGDSDLFALTIPGFYLTGPSTINYPPGLNVMSLVELRKSGSFKWLKVQRVIAGQNEYWINYFDALAWSGWKQLTFNYTPEDVANKETTALDHDTNKYPNNDVVLTALEAKANKILALETWYYFSDTSGDAVGDKRHGVFSGWYKLEECIGANATRGNGQWYIFEMKRMVVLSDSNETEGAGSYIDIPLNLSGILEVFCHYSDLYYAKVAWGNSLVFMERTIKMVNTLISGQAQVVIKIDGSNLRIVNELGGSMKFNIKVTYSEFSGG